MGNAYADLAALKSPGLLNIPEGADDGAQDGRLLGLLETASRWIDGYCGRSFAAVSGERRFDGDGGEGLGTPDLVRVSRLRTRPPGRTTGGGDGDGWTEWSAGEYLLYPLNGAPETAGGAALHAVDDGGISVGIGVGRAAAVSGGSGNGVHCRRVGLRQGAGGYGAASGGRQGAGQRGRDGDGGAGRQYAGSGAYHPH